MADRSDRHPLGFGLLSAQRTAGDDRSWGRLYQETLELAAAADRLGYRSLWTTEHHFVDDGYMPSLLTMSAALAASTASIEIGTGVVLAPLHHPLRLAEDAATVQLVSRGRLVLGLGLGWSPIEFAAFGRDRTTRGRAMDEILDILPRAWRGTPFRHEGAVYTFPEVGVRPVPDVPIPIIIGGGAEAAVRRAACKADGFFSNAPADRLGEQVGWARDELESARRDPDGFRWLHYSVMYPCDDADRGWEEIRDHVWLMRWKYSDMEASARRDGLASHPPLDPAREGALRESVLVGPADQIAARLHEIRTEAGVPVEFIARSFFQAFPLSRQLELMERLATEVGPLL